MGLSREDFWSSTLRELLWEFSAIRKRRRDEFERDSLIGYQAVKTWLLSLRKKGYRMPKFDLIVGREAGPQTPQQMRAAMEVIAAQVGGRVHAHARKWRGDGE